MKSMNKIVISVGGSIVNPGNPDITFIKSLSSMLKELRPDMLGLVVGGGRPARTYVDAMREMGSDNYSMDLAGIMATRMNAMMLISAMGIDQKTIPETIGEAHDILLSNKIVVMGGTVPGHTTDTVATLLAESCGAETVYNMTSVDGVYDSDPKISKSAKMFDKLDYREAFEISLKSYTGAASNQFMDSVSLLIAMRSKIKICIFSGTDLQNARSAFNGKKFKGTVIG